jgi:hypothetical protein
VQTFLLLGEAPFLGLILELQSDQSRFQEAKKKNGEDRRKNTPEQHVYPPRNSEFEFRDKCAADAQEAENEDRENGGSVAGIYKRVIEAALVTSLTQIE